MKKLATIILLFAGLTRADASWWWPFGDDDDNEPRVSELMEPVTILIDKAADYADEGKTAEAIAEFRKALDELGRIEIENADRVGKPEFATVRNKRAYVNSSIDTLLFRQASDNARAIAVTDPSGLEKRYRAELAEKKAAKERERTVATAPTRTTATAEESSSRKDRMAKAKSLLAEKNYALAAKEIEALLAERPNDPPALNLKAMLEMAQGDYEAAETTFASLIQSNPRSYYGHYNLARLILKSRGDEGRDSARRHYIIGRDFCDGPKDPELEELLK